MPLILFDEHGNEVAQLAQEILDAPSGSGGNGNWESRDVYSQAMMAVRDSPLIASDDDESGPPPGLGFPLMHLA